MSFSYRTCGLPQALTGHTSRMAVIMGGRRTVGKSPSTSHLQRATQASRVSL